MGALIVFTSLFLTFFIFFSLLYLFRKISDVDNELIEIIALFTAIFISAYTVAFLYSKSIKYVVKNNKIEVIKKQSFWFMKDKNIKYYDINKTYKGI